MHDLYTADKLYKEMLMENPKLAEELIMDFRETMPDEYAKVMYCKRYGKHIIDLEQYKYGLSLIKGQDGRSPQIWSIEDAEKVLSNYFRDYDKEDFYKYDAILWLNIRRNDYPKITDTEELAYIVFEDLHDMDYPTDPSERVYDWVEENAKND